METKRTILPWILSLIFVLISFQVVFATDAGNVLQIAQAEPPKGKPVSIRGKISAVEGENLKVMTSSGEVLVRVPEKTRIGGVQQQSSATLQLAPTWVRLRRNNRMVISVLWKSISFRKRRVEPVKGTGHGI